MNWVKVGTNVGVGVVAGAVKEFIADKDAERPQPLKWYQEYGTYYNYGFPLASILLATFGVIRGDWETRLVTAGATLAGSKGYRQIKAAAVAPYQRWTPQGEASRRGAEVARQRAIAEARQRATESAAPIQIEEEEILA